MYLKLGTLGTTITLMIACAPYTLMGIGDAINWLSLRWVLIICMIVSGILTLAALRIAFTHLSLRIGF